MYIVQYTYLSEQRDIYYNKSIKHHHHGRPVDSTIYRRSPVKPHVSQQFNSCGADLATLAADERLRT